MAQMQEHGQEFKCAPGYERTVAYAWIRMKMGEERTVRFRKEQAQSGIRKQVEVLHMMMCASKAAFRNIRSQWNIGR